MASLRAELSAQKVVAAQNAADTEALRVEVREVRDQLARAAMQLFRANSTAGQSLDQRDLVADTLALQPGRE